MHPGRLFNVLLAMSVVSCAASAALWARSRATADMLTGVTRGGTFVQAVSRDGKAYLAVAERWPDDCSGYYTGPAAWWFGPVFCGADGMSEKWERAGGYLVSGHFSVATTDGRTIVQVPGEPEPEATARATGWPLCPGFEVCVPWPAAMAVFYVLPMMWLARGARRLRRRRRGCCAACGYDLRASPGRCPECGAATRAKPAEGPPDI